MKISEIYKLKMSQNELDFVDINIDNDTPLFVDPYLIANQDYPFAIEANRRIKNFFSYLIELLISKQYEDARKIFKHVGEINETCLGLSKGSPRGNGIGPVNTEDIFEELKNSKAVELQLMEGIEDLRLFIRGVDRDKISDMTSNIIRKLLMEYTKNQCELLGIPLTPNIQSGYYWDYQTRSWRNELTEMLVINDKRYLLVPKIIVSYSNAYSSSEYYNQYVLNFLQEENIRERTSLVQFRKEKKGYSKPYVTKKSIMEIHEREIGNDDKGSLKKEWLAGFTKTHLNVLRDFKVNVKDNEKNVDYNEDRAEIAKYLIDKLKKIPTGAQSASKYHNTIICILEFIFYPNICNPKKEYEEHQGRKRIDIVYDNSAKENFFFDLMAKFNIPANFIIVECKNYSTDVNNPELDQLSGRFSFRRGKFGMMLCRTVDNMETLLKRCSDTYNDDRGLIIPIVDNDILTILNDISEGRENSGLSILLERYRRISFN